MHKHRTLILRRFVCPHTARWRHIRKSYCESSMNATNIESDFSTASEAVGRTALARSSHQARARLELIPPLPQEHCVGTRTAAAYNAKGYRDILSTQPNAGWCNRSGDGSRSTAPTLDLPLMLYRDGTSHRSKEHWRNECAAAGLDTSRRTSISNSYRQSQCATRENCDGLLTSSARTVMTKLQ